MASAKLLLALALIPCRLIAQESTTDTTPFHRGQWAVQFGGGLNLFSFGVLRFTSPRSAWVLDLTTYAQFLDSKRTDNLGGGTTSADDQVIAIDARLGRRFYQSPRRQVVSFQSFGVEGALLDQFSDYPTGTIRRTVWSAGLHGDVGGSYMVTQSLSLGASAGISAGYFSRKDTDFSFTSKGSGWYIDGVRVVFLAGLYF